MGMAAWQFLVGSGAGVDVDAKDMAGRVAAGGERDDQGCINNCAGVDARAGAADVDSGHVRSDGYRHRGAVVAARAGA
jgi:hypothetical protein